MKPMTVSTSRAREIASRLKSLSVIVVGDAMLDEYLWGEVDRISPEAPVPVVRVRDSTFKLGGAANVAYNLGKLGVTAHLVSVCGHDRHGDSLRALMQESNMCPDGLYVSRQRPTTVKTRIMAQHQQILRADQESCSPLNDEESRPAISRVKSLLPKAQAVILSDYAKGMLCGRFLRSVLDLCDESRTFAAVDPKLPRFDSYRGATVITPNLSEACRAAGKVVDGSDIAEVETLAQTLVSQTGVPYLLVTLGENGLALFDADQRECSHVRAAAREVYDITGAGDTVIGVFTAATAAGAKPAEAAYMANVAAGLTVNDLGTVGVDPARLIDVCGAEGKERS